MSFINRSVTPLKRRQLPKTEPSTPTNVPASSFRPSEYLKTPENDFVPATNIDERTTKHSSFRLRLLELENSLKRPEPSDSSEPTQVNDPHLSLYNNFLKSLTRRSPQRRRPRPQFINDVNEISDANTLQRDTPEQIKYIGNFDYRKGSDEGKARVFERSNGFAESVPLPKHSKKVPRIVSRSRPKSCPKKLDHNDTSRDNFLEHTMEPLPTASPRTKKFTASRLVDSVHEDALIKEAASVSGNVHNLRKLLRNYDLDGDGYLTTQEYTTALRSLNINVPVNNQSSSSTKLVDCNNIISKANALVFNQTRRFMRNRARSPFAQSGESVPFREGAVYRKSIPDSDVVNPVNYLQSSKYSKPNRKPSSPQSEVVSARTRTPIKTRVVHPESHDILAIDVPPQTIDTQKMTSTYDSNALSSVLATMDAEKHPPVEKPRRLLRPRSAPSRQRSRDFSKDEVDIAAKIELRLRKHPLRLKHQVLGDSLNGKMPVNSLQDSFKCAGVHLDKNAFEKITQNYKTSEGLVDCVKLTDELPEMSQQITRKSYDFPPHVFAKRSPSQHMKRTTGSSKPPGFVLPPSEKEQDFISHHKKKFPPPSTVVGNLIKQDSSNPQRRFRERPRSAPNPARKAFIENNQSQICLTQQNEPVTYRRRLRGVENAPPSNGIF
ncbi:hypothetical protein P9112_006715 [Eukaryota sp. TZLM1-RC]